MTKLILGTAQFGAGYGITNERGRIPDEEVRAILGIADAAGVSVLDTAPEYNDAQERLGRLRPARSTVAYVSKFGMPELDIDRVESLFEPTLRALRVSRLYGLLFHRPADLRAAELPAVWDGLRRARDSGVIDRIGASIYDAHDLEIAAERLPELSIIQVPGSVLDRRLLEHELLHELRAGGAEVHVRSVYMQGVLLSDPAGLPEHLAPLAPALEELRSMADRLGRSLIDVALGALKHDPVVDGVLVGAASEDEFSSTVSAWADARPVPKVAVPSLPSTLLDPRTWPPREGPR